MQHADRMNWNSTGARALGIASVGHAVFAATMVALGILGLIQGGFTPTWSGVPKGLPAREALAYLCAFISLVSGIGLLWRRAAVIASRVLLTALLVWLLLFRVTLIVRAPTATVAWWASGDTAVMAAAAWVLYTWFAGDWDRQRLSFATGDKGLRIPRGLYGRRLGGGGFLPRHALARCGQALAPVALAMGTTAPPNYGLKLSGAPECGPTLLLRAARPQLNAVR